MASSPPVVFVLKKSLLMIPLLREIDRELALGLSVDDVERKLLERARSEVSAWI